MINMSSLMSHFDILNLIRSFLSQIILHLIQQTEFCQIMDNIRKTIESMKQFHLKTIDRYNQMLKSQYANFQSKYLKFYETFAKLMETSEALGAQLSASKEHNSNLKQNNRMLIRENQELVMKNNDLNSTIDQLQKQLDTFRESLSSEHQQNEKLAGELDIMEINTKKYETLCTDQERLVTELQEKFGKNEVELRLIKRKYDTLNKEYLDKTKIYESQIQLLVNKLNEIDGQKYEHLQSDIKNLEQQSTIENLKNIDLQKQIEVNQYQLKELTQERNLLKSQVSSLLIRIDDIKHGRDKSQNKPILKSGSNSPSKHVHFDL